MAKGQDDPLTRPSKKAHPEADQPGPTSAEKNERKAPAADARERIYQKWLDEDALWIVTDQEHADFSKLNTNQQRDEFVVAFWERRNPLHNRLGIRTKKCTTSGSPTRTRTSPPPFPDTGQTVAASTSCTAPRTRSTQGPDRHHHPRSGVTCLSKGSEGTSFSPLRTNALAENINCQ